MPDYFTLAEIRALPDVTEGGFTDDQIEAAAAHFAAIVERETGASFIPRAHTETLGGNGCHSLVLARTPSALTSVTVDGEAVTVGLLSSRSGVLRYLDGATVWPATELDNIVVVYTAGEAECPADVKDAVMWATRDRLISQSSQNGIDPRRTSMTNDLGGTVNYVLPGEKRPTGYPELDALIASYSRSQPGGFA